MNLFYKEKAHEAYISHVKVQLTAAKENVYLVLVYGISEPRCGAILRRGFVRFII